MSYKRQSLTDRGGATVEGVGSGEPSDFFRDPIFVVSSNLLNSKIKKARVLPLLIAGAATTISRSRTPSNSRSGCPHFELHSLCQFVLWFFPKFQTRSLSTDKRESSHTPGFSNELVSFSASSAPSGNQKSFCQRVQFESRNPGQGVGVSCKYCKKSGHIIEKFYKLHGFPPDFKFTQSKRSASCVHADTSSIESSVQASRSQPGTSSTHGLSQEQYQQLVSLLQQANITPGTNNNGSSEETFGFANFAGLLKRSVVNFVDFHVCAYSQLSDNTWILYFGTTNHMTPYKQFLHNLKPLPAICNHSS
uniref:Uncharacterized protein n=1 Tax=Nicotiana tabacum TaxID=4097 RepID=A0A1S3XP87_TOBAC|nr:PREDICTED: uncharacterized protein LOC107767299 [Nicotiana tabacum]